MKLVIDDVWNRWMDGCCKIIEISKPNNHIKKIMMWRCIIVDSTKLYATKNNRLNFEIRYPNFKRFQEILLLTMNIPLSMHTRA